MRRASEFRTPPDLFDDGPGSFFSSVNAGMQREQSSRGETHINDLWNQAERGVPVAVCAERITSAQPASMIGAPNPAAGMRRRSLG